MEYGTADHHMRGCVGKRHALDTLHPKIRCRKMWREPRGKFAHLIDRLRIRIRVEDLPPRPEQVDPVASVSTPGVEHGHSFHDPASQHLVEKVDIDVAELLQKVWHTHHR